MANRIDATGHRYSRILVVSYAGKFARRLNGRKLNMWNCVCDCGRKVILALQDLRQGRTSSCGCARKRFTDSSSRQVYQTYRSRCKKTGKTFELTYDEFLFLTAKDCHYCGAPPSNRAVYRHFKEEWFYNGIDRKDNNFGYIVENSLPCCDICNKAKRAMSYDEFLGWIQRIREQPSVLHL